MNEVTNYSHPQVCFNILIKAFQEVGSNVMLYARAWIFELASTTLPAGMIHSLSWILVAKPAQRLSIGKGSSDCEFILSNFVINMLLFIDPNIYFNQTIHFLNLFLEWDSLTPQEFSHPSPFSSDDVHHP